MAAADQMTLRFLGAGGAFSRQLGTTCSALTLGDQLWLIDCGRQAPDQVSAAGISWHHIYGQIVTHVHGDHIYGMEDLAFQRYYQAEAGVESIRDGGPRPLLLCHSAVREEVWETLASSLRYIPDPDAPSSGTLETYFEIVEPSGSEAPLENPWPRAESFVAGPLAVTTRDTVHVPGKPSTSLEIGVGDGRRVAWWSGDSTVDPEFLIALEPRATIIFHDCTFIEYPGQVHGSFQALESLPEEVRRKTVLMHHEDNIEDNRTRAEAMGFRIGMPGHAYDLNTGLRG